ncbi:MAG: Trm112 family protein [Oleiphilaceae bacterium]|nr:Trm112 family protein [Oleiphilaceae bacterium]
MDKKLVALLACPVCKGDLHLDHEKQELVCRNDAMAFPIREGIPVMLATEARTLTTDERLEKKR